MLANASYAQVLYVEKASSTRTFQMRLHSYQGSGRYQLFIASEVDDYGEAIEAAYEAEVPWGGWEDQRARASMSRMRGWMLAATDGQYSIDPEWELETDLGDWLACWSCRDIIFMDSNHGGCVSAKVPFPGPGGFYIEVSKDFWRGADTSCGYSPATVDEVGRTLTHEWGHSEFGMFDEFETDPYCSECSHSLMSGSWVADCKKNGFCYFNFCSDHDHQIDPEGSCSGLVGDDNWANIVDEHSSMSGPAQGRTSDHFQLRELRSRMIQYTEFTQL